MAGRRRSSLALGLLVSSVYPTFTTTASETITYNYDVRGQLLKVSRSGTVNNGVKACYTYDKGQNRAYVGVVITDCDPAAPPPTFSINDVSATEGGLLTFTVTKSGTTSNSYSVDYATANGSAIGSDYTSGSGTLTFAAADTTKSVTIQTTDDATVEDGETLVLNLSNVTGDAGIIDFQGVGSINDNESETPPVFKIGNSAANDGGNLVFTVTKTGIVARTYRINFATAGNPPFGGVFQDSTGTLTFGPAEATKTVTVPTFEAASGGQNTQMTVQLSGATGGATIGFPSYGNGTIIDNEGAPPPTYYIGDAIGTEGVGVTFTITRAGSTGFSKTINYSTQNNGTATVGVDYVGANGGTVTFAAGQATKTVTISTLNNTTPEPGEFFYVNISLVCPCGSEILADGQGIGTIYDND